MRLYDIITSFLGREAALWLGLGTSFAEDWSLFVNHPCLWERPVVHSY